MKIGAVFPNTEISADPAVVAELTSTIQLVTAVIILGQRQTALVAKQAACVDVLAAGRLRLG